MSKGLSSAAGSVCQFDSYELDRASLELRKAGRKLKLAPQPARVLGLLASRAGELVTRDEIRREIWGEQTFVDFERGLNYCVNSIRAVLGDDAQSPQYIETLPRRGYRFIAPVETVPSPSAGSTVLPSIAVLPFTNLSADQGNVYFSDGLADEIITALTRVQGLRVTSRTSSFVFRDQKSDVREIGAKLGVSTVLEGSVQRYSGRIRVSAQLVSATDGFHLWSEHYDCKVADIFSVQDEISQAIARALAVRLAPARTVRPTSNLEAYNYWLKARHHQHYEDLAALPKCRACLDQAIALDPHFPQPYLGLADLFLGMVNFGLICPRYALAQGRAAISKAIELDDSVAEIYALSGAYRALLDFDWSGASADFDRALDLTPASEQSHRMRAVYYLVPTGRLLEAEQEMEHAVELDPLSPLAYIELVKVLLWERQFDRARARMETAFELWPEYALAKWFVGVTFYFQGRIEEALALWRPALQKIGNSPSLIGPIAMALGQLGHVSEARQMLAEMEAAQDEVYVPALSCAQVHVGLGENDAALQLLDRAVEEREPHILELPFKPIWDGLRKDPRFARLLRKMRLT